MQYVVTSAETTTIPHPELTVHAYASGDDSLSASMIDVRGGHPAILSTHSDRVYVVLSGTGTFDIDGKNYSVGERDVVFLPKNTAYSYRGEMELFLVHAPGFREGTDVSLR
jgi:mannose-6-phosphate isomerase-like protein (cupin superfamily)